MTIRQKLNSLVFLVYLVKIYSKNNNIKIRSDKYAFIFFVELVIPDKYAIFVPAFRESGGH